MSQDDFKDKKLSFLGIAFSNIGWQSMFHIHE